MAEDLQTEKRSEHSSFVVKINQQWTALERMKDDIDVQNRKRRTSSIEARWSDASTASSSVPTKKSGDAP